MRIAHLLAALTFLVSLSTAHAADTETFAGGAPLYSAPAQCAERRILHAACSRARSLGELRHRRALHSALACVSHLEEAIGHEDLMIEQHTAMLQLRGTARREYHTNVYNPTSQQRSRSLKTYSICRSQDLRPPGYPAADVLLAGGVSNVDRAPSDDGWNIKAAIQSFNDSLDPVAGPLQQLSGFLDAVAPHYDLTSRNDEGIRVARDLLVDAGMGHLLGNAPTALRAMTSKSDEVLDAGRRAATGQARLSGSAGGEFGNAGNPVFGKSTNNPFAPDHPLYVPPTLKVPPHIANRPLRLQEETHSCVQACARMVHETIHGGLLPEQWVKLLSGTNYVSSVGTRPGSVRKLLNEISVPNKGWTQSASLDTLANGVNGGYPAIVNYGKQHAVVVDAVIEHAGERFIVMRDPANAALVPPNVRLLQQNLGHQNVTILREEDFLPSFNAGKNVMLFTDPGL